jgi:hypothetical protein
MKVFTKLINNFTASVALIAGKSIRDMIDLDRTAPLFSEHFINNFSLKYDIYMASCNIYNKGL